MSERDRFDAWRRQPGLDHPRQGGERTRGGAKAREASGTVRTTIVRTVTGGTGPFSDASGTLISIPELSPISFDGVTPINRRRGHHYRGGQHRYGRRSVLPAEGVERAGEAIATTPRGLRRAPFRPAPRVLQPGRNH